MDPDPQVGQGFLIKTTSSRVVVCVPMSEAAAVTTPMWWSFNRCTIRLVHSPAEKKKK